MVKTYPEVSIKIVVGAAVATLACTRRSRQFSGSGGVALAQLAGAFGSVSASLTVKGWTRISEVFRSFVWSPEPRPYEWEMPVLSGAVLSRNDSESACSAELNCPRYT